MDNKETFPTEIEETYYVDDSIKIIFTYQTPGVSPIDQLAVSQTLGSKHLSLLSNSMSLN